MESKEVMVDPGVSTGGGVFIYNGHCLEQKHSEHGLGVSIDEEEKGEIADAVLEGFEEYWEDINDRLTISRMVSDAVIKGMVTAVEQEAAETIAAKELEVANLKERLRSHEEDTGKCAMKLPVVGEVYEMNINGKFSGVTDVYVKHEKMMEHLLDLRKSTQEQFKKVKKEVKCASGVNSMKMIGSVSELVGFSDQDNQFKSWMQVDKMLEGLNTTVDNVCSRMADLLQSSKISIFESQVDMDMLKELEDMVMQSAIRSLQEEKLLESNAQLHAANWQNKFNDISGLCTQLDAIQKLLCTHENGLISHGSHDLDHLHHKAFSTNVSALASFYGENGRGDESDVHVAESYEIQQLKHLSNEELVDYFNNIITKLKRDHESVLERRTEKYFSLKREYLKLTHRKKDEEFDVLRKKISEIISKLQGLFVENESVGKLNIRLDSLLFENCQLRDSLNSKKNEVMCLQAQISDASEALLQRSLTEENLLKLVEDLKSAMEDSCIENSLIQEVFKCALKEQIAQASYGSREICYNMTGEDANPFDTPIRYGVEDSDIESWIMQGLSSLILKETITDARSVINDLCREALVDKENRICLDTTAIEKANELRLEVEENMKLKKDIQDMKTVLLEKEKLANNMLCSWSEDRAQFEITSQELSTFREYASQQESLVTESNMHLELLKSQHLEALEKIEVYKMEMHKLKQNLDHAKEVLTEVNEERNKALTAAQEMQDKLLASEVREKKLKKEMELSVSKLTTLCDDFERRLSVVITKIDLRFEDTSSNLKALNKMANDLRRSELMYKQKLDLKSTNLQKAEDEVDLLGDEVDALLRLLNKIYIALDHYSPVLKHYPGIIETLELVRKELSGESIMLL